MQTDNGISLWPGIINGSPQNCNLKSHPWGRRTYYLGLFPNKDSRLLLMRAFPALFKSGYRMLAQVGDVYAVTSLYCFYFFSFNDCILRLSQIIFHEN